MTDITRSREPSDRQGVTVVWEGGDTMVRNQILSWLMSDGRLSAEHLDVVRQAFDQLPASGQDTKSATGSRSGLTGGFDFTSESGGDLDDRSRGPLGRGTVVGNYRIIEVIGRGGGGHVFSAEHLQTGQELALKVLSQTNASTRFRREMDLVCRLAHPNIVFAHEVGLAGGMWFIAMERLSGPDMRQKVMNDGPMPWRETITIIHQAARALDQAHTRGLVHRDIKPGNLIADGASVIKVADLGLAAMLTSESDSATSGDLEPSFHTRVEALGGTPGYMAPEQAHSLAAADARSDLYSLGATWFYLLTGQSMVPGDTWASRLGELIRGENIADLDAKVLPPPFLALWQQMTARDPALRMESARELLERIEAIWDGEEAITEERSIRILVVEDDQDDLFITMQSLRRFNSTVDVESACSLDEAIESVHQKAIDLVLLDLQLPDVSGLDTVSQFRSQCPDVATIVLSGREEAGLIEACQQRGADGFIAKHSLGVPELERVIFVTLARRR